MRKGRWWYLWLVSLGAVLVAMSVVLVAQQCAHPRTQASFHTPLTGQASWEGDWDLSPEGADPSQAGSLSGSDRVTIPFTGTGLSMRVRRGNYRGYFWVQVDGEPANQLPRAERGGYLVLTSPDGDPETVTLPVVRGLSEGPHVAEVVADRGWGQRPLVGWQVEQGQPASVFDMLLRGLAAASIVSVVGLLGCSIDRLTRQEAGAETEDSSHESSFSFSFLSSVIRPPGSTLQLLAALLISAGVFYTSPWLPLTLASGAALAGLTVLRLDLGLALVALTAPFYLHPRALLGKSFSMVEIVILLCAVSWLLRRAVQRNWQHLAPPSVSSADLAVLLLLTAAAVSTLFAEHRHVALRELRVVILEPALLYLIVRSARLDAEAVWRIVDAFVMGAVGVALIGLVQYGLDINVITAEQGFRRLRSVYGSPNNAALYLGRVLPVLLAVSALAGTRRRRLAYGSLTLPVALALLLTFSRGAILVGVPFSLLVLGLLAGQRWRWVALSLVVAAAIGVIPLLGTPRFAGMLNPQEGTLFFRLQLWRASWKMFQEHPWIGVGPDNFLYQYRGRYILPSAWQEPHLSHAHNVLLTFATRLGVLGLAAGLWLHTAFWQHALPLRGTGDADLRALGLGLMASMAYALAHGLVDASFFFVDLAVASLLALGLVQSMWRYHNYA